METKQELEQRLKEIYAEERKQKEIDIKKENFKKFKNRKEDYMIWKAHCDRGFLSAKYSSEIEKPLLPYWVTISWNVGYTYLPKAYVTTSTHRYLHNVWTDTNKMKFQEELLELVKKHIRINCTDLHSVLAMMWLQSTYRMEELFTDEDLKEVMKEIEEEQFKILDRYSDEDFKKLWDSSHSNRILKNYLNKKRPHITR